MDRDLYIDSLLRILSPLRRDLEAESGARGFGEAEVIENSVNADNRTVTAMLSTPNVDRYGEVIEPEAFRESLPMFRRNPVLLASHASSGHEPTAIGKWIEIDITKKGLVGTCRLMEDDELAEKWWKRHEQGVLRAFSVGFVVQATELRDFKMKDGTTQRLRVHTKSELLEVSCVALPANRESLVIGASAGGRGGEGSARQLSNRQLATALMARSPSMANRRDGSSTPASSARAFRSETACSARRRGSAMCLQAPTTSASTPSSKSTAAMTR